LKIQVFCDIVLCRMVKTYRRFEGTIPRAVGNCILADKA